VKQGLSPQEATALARAAMNAGGGAAVLEDGEVFYWAQWNAQRLAQKAAADKRAAARALKLIQTAGNVESLAVARSKRGK
jgi:hypothetical protein